MNTLVVYFSKYGNTEQVAQEIADVLAKGDGEGNGTVRLVFSDRLKASDLDGMDLVIMGSPTHRMNLPEAVQPLFGRLPKNALEGRQVAAFDTSYKMSWWLSHFTAASKLNRKLRKLGGRSFTSPETFHVTAKEGPLYDGELERAREWALSLQAKAKSKRH
jgi:flavodoxin